MSEIKPKMNSIDVEIEERMAYMMDVTFEEVMDILDKWEFILGQRAGRELWSVKPTDVQDKDLADFKHDLEKVRSFCCEK